MESFRKSCSFYFSRGVCSFAEWLIRSFQQEQREPSQVLEPKVRINRGVTKLSSTLSFDAKNLNDYMEKFIQTLVAVKYVKNVAGSKVTVVCQREFDRSTYDKVAVISGGRSGLEPAHAGFVGKGMLTAAICGDAFTCPTPEVILKCIEGLTSKKGCFLLVQKDANYSDNFKVAKERAKDQGLNIQIFIIGDDCSVRPTKTGRRGLAGSILFYKIIGAAAEEGYNLHQLISLSIVISKYIGTIGVSWPARDDCKGKIHYGSGTLGKDGHLIDYESQDGVVSQMVGQILSAVSRTSSPQTSRSCTFVLMTNGLDMIPRAELEKKSQTAISKMVERGCVQEQIISLHGNFMTSLSMSGFSISILAAFDKTGKKIVDYLNAPTDAPYWLDKGYEVGFREILLQKPRIAHPFLRPDPSLNFEERLNKRLKTHDTTLRSIVDGPDSKGQLWIFYEEKRFLASTLLQKIIRGLLDQITILEESSESYIPDVLNIDNIGYRCYKYESPIVLSYGHETKDNVQAPGSYYKDLKNIVSYMVDKHKLLASCAVPEELKEFLNDLENCATQQMKLRVRRHIFLYSTKQRIDVIRNIHIKDDNTKSEYSNALKPDPPLDFRDHSQIKAPGSLANRVFYFKHSKYNDSSWLSLIKYERHFSEHASEKSRGQPQENPIGAHGILYNMYPEHTNSIFEMMYCDPVGRLVLH